MKFKSTISIAFISLFSVANAGSLTLSIGPEQIGTGGAYPISVPPVDPFQWGFTWVTNSGFETTLSLCPGLLFGHRFKAEGFYLSVGGGLIVDGNGAGLGPYSSFGYVTGGGKPGWHLTASYSAALGITQKRILAPSAMRFGVLWEY